MAGWVNKVLIREQASSNLHFRLSVQSSAGSAASVRAIFQSHSPVLHSLSAGFKYVLIMCMRQRENCVQFPAVVFSPVIQNKPICFLCTCICKHKIFALSTLICRGAFQEGKRRERERVRQQTCSETESKKEDKDRSCEKSLLFQRRFLFLGWCCVTNLMGAAPRIRAARGLLGMRTIHWFPNWWECSETANFIGLVFGCLSSNQMHSREWRLWP